MKMRHVFNLFLMISCLTFLVSEGSAASGKVPMGTWKSDSTTKQIFETGKILPNHTYYYTGSINGPDCLIAIDNNFTMKKSNPVWAKADEMSDKILKGWMQFFKTEGADSSSIQGGVILTPDGKKAGIWYSHYPVNIVLMPEPGVLDIFQPHPASGNPSVHGN